MSEILTVHREWVTSNNQVTFLRNEKGLVVDVVTNPLKQPKKAQKTITIKGKEYQLKFQ